MTERPILFSGPMVRALLAGVKRQTRRVLTLPRGMAWYPDLGGEAGGWYCDIGGKGWWHLDELRCPHGAAGVRLWVRETYAIVAVEGCRISVARAERMPEGKTLADTDGGLETIQADRATAAWAAQRVDCERWKPAIFMPRWACRLMLEVADVRVERLQDITEDDAIAEGCLALGDSECTARRQYQLLWDSLNAGRGFGWRVNPWVWVIDFRKAQ